MKTLIQIEIEHDDPLAEGFRQHVGEMFTNTGVFRLARVTKYTLESMRFKLVGVAVVPR